MSLNTVMIISKPKSHISYEEVERGVAEWLTTMDSR